MSANVVRILVSLLILSQTWVGSLRGMDLCIPLGMCRACVTVSSGGEGDACRMHDHVHDHVLGHAHDHTHGWIASHAALEVTPCDCHIHLATPDDEPVRSTVSFALSLSVTGCVRSVNRWMLAACAPTDDRPPPRSRVASVDPSRVRQRALDVTVLLV